MFGNCIHAPLDILAYTLIVLFTLLFNNIYIENCDYIQYVIDSLRHDGTILTAIQIHKI